MTRVGRLAVLMLTAASGGCSPGASERDMAVRQWTDDLAFRITSSPRPPRAAEPIRFTVVVKNKETGEPIEHGQGRIFATNKDRVTTWDGLRKGPELGTYYAEVTFVTAGDWAVALEFRRDSTRALERMDWRQDVQPAAEPGS